MAAQAAATYIQPRHAAISGTFITTVIAYGYGEVDGMKRKEKIFVSCGQLSNKEKALGNAIARMIGDTVEFEPFFADTIQSLSSLRENIFPAIQECAGAVFILHARDTIVTTDGPCAGRQSSTWVSQELAVLSYRSWLESTHIPAIVFTEAGIRKDGMIKALMCNPIEFITDDIVIDNVRNWLQRENFSIIRVDIFMEKWHALSMGSKMVISALIDEGEERVTEYAIRRRLAGRFNLDANEASRFVEKARLELRNATFADIDRFNPSGAEMSLRSTYRLPLRRENRLWLEAIDT